MNGQERLQWIKTASPDKLYERALELLGVKDGELGTRTEFILGLSVVDNNLWIRQSNYENLNPRRFMSEYMSYDSYGAISEYVYYSYNLLDAILGAWVTWVDCIGYKGMCFIGNHGAITKERE